MSSQPEELEAQSCWCLRGCLSTHVRQWRARGLSVVPVPELQFRSNNRFNDSRLYLIDQLTSFRRLALQLRMNGVESNVTCFPGGREDLREQVISNFLLRTPASVISEELVSSYSVSSRLRVPGVF
jgi:hypothetical protein